MNKCVLNCLLISMSYLFVCHRNGAAHTKHHCWHGDLSGSLEGKCGPDSLKIEGILDLQETGKETVDKTTPATVMELYAVILLAQCSCWCSYANKYWL